MTITGNTYPVKDQLKALGGRWNPTAKGWDVPSAKADEARRLVAGTFRPSGNLMTSASQMGEKISVASMARSTARKSGAYECLECGERIYGGGECRNCGGC